MKFLKNLWERAKTFANALINSAEKTVTSSAIGQKLQQAALNGGLKGTLSGLALGVVTAIVALFIGLYMISKVSDVASINNTSDFYSTYQDLVTNTGTIFSVIILVVIVVALGIAIGVLRGFGETKTSESSTGAGAV